jgi:hypothetical protein
MLVWPEQYLYHMKQNFLYNSFKTLNDYRKDPFTLLAAIAALTELLLEVEILILCMTNYQTEM